MKEIRQIKNPVSVTYQDENNNQDKTKSLHQPLSLDIVQSEPKYFKLVVKPMLAPGHDSELIYWMKSIGLLPQLRHCKVCQKQMNWSPAHTNDLFRWSCSSCDVKSSIREQSFFNETKCSFKTAIKALLAWSNGSEIDDVADLLEVKKSLVSSVFSLASRIADKYIRNHLSLWKIGGKNLIVLVDTFPDGCTNGYRFLNNKPILCLAEVKEIPPRYWFEPLEKYTRRNVETIHANKRKCLEVIRSMVHPESILVTSRSSALCSYKDVSSCLRDAFPTIVSTDGLARHNTETKFVAENLGVIWREALNICVAAQRYPSSCIRAFLSGYLWRRRYSESAFEVLLNEMTNY